MKQKIIWILLLAVLVCACTACKQEAAVPTPEASSAEEPAPEQEPELPKESEAVEAGPETHEAVEADVEIPEATGPYGTIMVDVPENWSWEAFPVDSDGLTYGQYGLVLKPKDAAGGKLEIVYSDNFAVCGTGLKEEEITLAGVPALRGVYDGGAHWDFIIYRGDKEHVVAQALLCASWSETMWEEALQILDTVRLDPDQANGGVWQYSPECENEAIALVMDVRNVSDSGCTVHFLQYDDIGVETISGEAFYLERQTADGWARVPEIVEEWSFTEEGLPIPSGGEAEFETDWTWLYGTLEPGVYRICKNVVADGTTYELKAQFLLA